MNGFPRWYFYTWHFLITCRLLLLVWIKWILLALLKVSLAYINCNLKCMHRGATKWKTFRMLSKCVFLIYTDSQITGWYQIESNNKPGFSFVKINPFIHKCYRVSINDLLKSSVVQACKTVLSFIKQLLGIIHWTAFFCFCIIII